MSSAARVRPASAGKLRTRPPLLRWTTSEPSAGRSAIRPESIDSGSSTPARRTSSTHGPGRFTHGAWTGGRRSFQTVWLSTAVREPPPGHAGASRSPHFTRELKAMKLPSP
jgi:hypothetical protein